MSTQGTAPIDFGTGKSDASAVVTGQAAYNSATMLVEAWIDPIVTANNTIDNHWVEDFSMPMITNKITGTGFTIVLRCRNGNASGIYNSAWVFN